MAALLFDLANETLVPRRRRNKKKNKEDLEPVCVCTRLRPYQVADCQEI
jgi:hypothetical protein